MMVPLQANVTYYKISVIIKKITNSTTFGQLPQPKQRHRAWLGQAIRSWLQIGKSFGLKSRARNGLDGCDIVVK
jgi:phage major head subunit gpT-like protein